MKIKFIPISLLFFYQLANAQWSSFASGNTNGTVVDFALYNGELYATGLFTQINGIIANGVARWDGAAWQPIDNGFTDGGHRLTVIGDTLFLARYEMQVDSNWIYYLDNGAWEKLGTGFYLSGANAGQFYTCSMYDVVQYNGEVYASGEFNRNGGQAINGIAKWDGDSWSAVGGGFTAPFFGSVIYPHQMLVHDGKLYACGNFTKADNVQVNGVAVWDGSNWSALGEGFNSTVYALGIFNGELYAGGDFSASGSNPVGAVAKWDGAQWVSPGFGFQYLNPNGYLFVHTLQSINGKLYIAGGFDQVSPSNGAALPAGSIVAFDGQNIETLAGGANNDVEGLIDYDGKLLVGGFFSTVGNGTNASKLAIYDPAPSAIKPAVEAPIFNIYPNPTGAIVNIAYNMEGSLAYYKIADAHGRVLQNGIATPQISIAQLDAGIYFFSLWDDGGVKSFKLLKSN